MGAAHIREIAIVDRGVGDLARRAEGLRPDVKAVGSAAQAGSWILDIRADVAQPSPTAPALNT